MKRIVISVLAGLMLFLSSAYALSAVKRCEFCHAGHGGSGALLTADISALCTGCHPERQGSGEHKVDISPPMAVKELPLRAGRMTCITCHDPHSQASGMLRKPAGELCLLCHDK